MYSIGMKKKKTIPKVRRVVVTFNTGTRFHKSKKEMMDKADKKDFKNHKED